MTQPRNNIRGFALICVAATSAYIMWMGWWINTTLAAPQWCARALGAGNIIGKDKTVQGLEGCIDLLKIQLNSLAWNSHILFGVVALCLLVLIVIVIAGGKFSFKASKEGIEGDIGEAPQAAQVVADAAQNKADEVKEAVQ
jgi:hypothetical protein